MREPSSDFADAVVGKHCTPALTLLGLAVALALTSAASAAMAGEPVDGVDVNLGKNPPRGHGIALHTDASGRFSRRLTKGHYTLSAVCRKQGACSPNSLAISVAGVPIKPRAEGTMTYDFTVGAQPAIVSGNVHAAVSETPANCCNDTISGGSGEIQRASGNGSPELRIGGHQTVDDAGRRSLAVSGGLGDTLSGGRQGTVAGGLDTLIGGSAADRRATAAAPSTGSGGLSDTLLGGGQSSVVGGGNDTLMGAGQSRLSVKGGSVSGGLRDTLLGGGQSSVVGGGLDTLIGGSAADRRATAAAPSTGSGGLSDTLLGGGQSSVVGGGNDTLMGAGQSRLSVKAGSVSGGLRDTLLGGGQSSVVGGGLDTLIGGSAADRRATAAAPSAGSGGLSDTLLGGGQSSVVGGGNDTLMGAGQSRLSVKGGSVSGGLRDTLLGGGQSSVVGGGLDTLIGGSAADRRATAAAPSTGSGGLSDTLLGGGQSSVVGGGNDTLMGAGQSRLSLEDGSGASTVNVSSGRSYRTDGNSTVNVSSGSASIQLANRGNDTIMGGANPEPAGAMVTPVALSHGGNPTQYQHPTAISPSGNIEPGAINGTQSIEFRWTAVDPAPAEPVTYRVSIWKAVPGQSVKVAMATNPPILTRDVVDTTQASIAIPGSRSGASSEAHSYVWSVQALDGDGRSFGENNGMSDASRFGLASEPGVIAPGAAAGVAHGTISTGVVIGIGAVVVTAIAIGVTGGSSASPHGTGGTTH